MPPQTQQQPQGGDNSLGPFWIIVGIFAVGWGVWYFAHEQIAAFVLQVKLWEAEFVSWVYPPAQAQVSQIKNTAATSITPTMLGDISTTVGNYFRYPFAVLLAVLAVIVYLSNPNMRYKKTHNMQSLVNEEKENWPQISPVADLNLTSEDIDEGPWAMAMSPMQFAKNTNLLQEEKVVVSEVNFDQRGKITVSLLREEAYRVFSLQLGRYWTGVDNLNLHTKALFAIFAARANRDRDGSTALLLQISGSSKTGTLNYSGTEELLAKHKNSKFVTKVINTHAFVLTAMASMLEHARTDGVLASAEFLWLKPIDRSLWYMLNSVGRQTVFSEIAGPFAHWLAEKKIGRRLSVPMVDEAVNALEAALKEVIYSPEAEEGSS